MSYNFVDQETAPLRVIRLPVTDMVYTMGVDAATGLGDDYSCIQIVTNTIPNEQVAVFRQQTPTHTFSKICNDLGLFYNIALNVCEINYPGNSVQEALLQYYRYPRNYQSESHLDENVDISSKYGFRTTEASKWLLINEFQIALSNDGIIINDPTTIDEFRNFVYQSAKSKTGAAAGFCDDTVMALMLAYHGAKLYPIVRSKIETKKREICQDPDVQKSWRLLRQQQGKVLSRGMVL